MVSKKEHKSMLKVGTILRGIYRIDDYLASGGFGNTYLATNIEFDEQVAIKEFFMRGVSERDDDSLSIGVSNEENVEMFEKLLNTFKREAKRLHKLGKRNIPHVVRVFDLFEENNTSYYVMQYIKGRSLSGVLKAQGKPFDQQWIMECLLPQMLEALGGIHATNLWHLDIKPSNIMIDEQGNVTLIDFGSSKQIDPSSGDHVTMSSTLSFTKIYAPLELLHYDYKSIGPWSDIYSLGATLYNLATNQKPPGAYEILNEGVNAFNFPQGSRNDLTKLIVWMMSYKVSDRPQNVGQINDIIKGVKGKSIPKPPRALQQPVEVPKQEVAVATPKPVVPVAAPEPKVPVAAPKVDYSQENTIADKPVVPNDNSLPSRREPDESKSKKPLIFALIGVAVVAIIAMIIFSVIRNKRNDDKQSPGVELSTSGDSSLNDGETSSQVEDADGTYALPSRQSSSKNEASGGNSQQHASKSSHQQQSQQKPVNQPQPSSKSSQPQPKIDLPKPKSATSTSKPATQPIPQQSKPSSSSGGNSSRPKSSGSSGVSRQNVPRNTDR